MSKKKRKALYPLERRPPIGVESINILLDLACGDCFVRGSPALWSLMHADYVVLLHGELVSGFAHITEKGRGFIEGLLTISETTSSSTKPNKEKQVEAFVAGAMWWENHTTGAALSPSELALAQTLAEDRYCDLIPTEENRPTI
jgi:hypothetical protein